MTEKYQNLLKYLSIKPGGGYIILCNHRIHRLQWKMAGQYIVSETIETGGGGHYREIKYLHKERGKNTQ